jgi:hypothetical protein
MLQGPVGSPYPGKYVSFVFAAFFAVVTWRASRSAIQAGREQRTNAALGVAVKPDAKKSVGANAAVAVGAFLLLVPALAAVYTEWPH